MVDYWKSNERHYCKYCNVWTQGDKSSIRHHEQGGKHKSMVENALKAKRKEKSSTEMAERELQQQLKEIEAAAHARYAQDLAATGAPPPPPPRPTHMKQNLTRNHDAPRGKQHYEPFERRQEQPELDEEPPKEDDKGIYAVRGVVYLEGKRHEEQLVVGSACQIWVEEFEEWLDALVEKATVHEVPNTTLSFRRFSITYMPPNSATPVTEEQLGSDRLRIKLPEGMSLEDAERMVAKLASGEAQTVEEAHVPVDATTGMGEWSTVVVTEIDESDEAVAQREAQAEAEEVKRMEEEKRRDALEDFSGQGDNALGAFNPWGGNYKGIELDKESVASKKARDEEIMIQADGDVSFKKRKTGESVQDKKKKKQRRIRSGDDD